MYVFPNYTIYDRLSSLFIGLMRINHEQYFFLWNFGLSYFDFDWNSTYR